jgi:ubiquinone/menaquinone biosynthesis C-methylase UbiE
MKKELKNIYTKFIPNYSRELELAIKNCESVLDVGCGKDSPIQFFSKKIYSVGVDIFNPSLDKSKKSKIHNKYVKMDVLNIGKRFEDKSFDCVLASDLIEHLEKKDGLKLIKQMEKIAKKKVIIFTPNGFLKQGEYDKNPWQVHKSGWSAKEMKKMGYKIIGIRGWKKLRGEYASIKYKPELFWKIISEITQIYTKRFPEHAFQILCVKNKKK